MVKKWSKKGGSKVVKKCQKWGISKSVNFRGVKNGQKVEKKRRVKSRILGGSKNVKKLIKIY